jgi:hypothetical protein
MSCNCQHNTQEHTSYEQLTENEKIQGLGQLITAITCVTEHQDSQEYAQLKEDTDELDTLKEFMLAMLSDDLIASALQPCSGAAILTFIQQHQEHLKEISSSRFFAALKAIGQGKDQNFSEQPESFSEHPIELYADLLHDIVETKFSTLSEEEVAIITRVFNYCCLKLYTECAKVEEQVNKKIITSIVDCMWLFTLLDQHKEECIYVLGGWRFANMMARLEELREEYADQPLENLEDAQMLKLMEALVAGASTKECGCEDEEDEGCCCGSK